MLDDRRNNVAERGVDIGIDEFGVTSWKVPTSLC
jgi:hypothetical protein